MCVAAAAVPAISLAVSAVSTGYGIYQGQQQAQYQQQQAAMAQQQAQQNYQLQQQQLAAQQQQAANAAQMQYNNSVTQSRYQNQMAINQHQGDVRAQQAARMSYEQQVVNNEAAANRVYTSEQLKLKEARDKAAFRSQEVYAKQIGAMGKVLASGQTGKSVARRAQDTERQAGFAKAEAAASLDSANIAADFAMIGAEQKLEGANNQAFSAVPDPVQSPFLAADPAPAPGFGYTGDMGIPSYNWG